MSGQALRQCWHAYERSLQKHPIRTQALMTATLWCVDVKLFCVLSPAECFLRPGLQGTSLLSDLSASAEKRSASTTIVELLSLLLMVGH